MARKSASRAPCSFQDTGLIAGIVGAASRASTLHQRVDRLGLVAVARRALEQLGYPRSVRHERRHAAGNYFVKLLRKAVFAERRALVADDRDVHCADHIRHFGERQLTKMGHAWVHGYQSVPADAAGKKQIQVRSPLGQPQESLEQNFDAAPGIECACTDDLRRLRQAEARAARQSVERPKIPAYPVFEHHGRPLHAVSRAYIAFERPRHT